MIYKPPADSVLILGSGLCGLTLAYRLRQRGIDSTILEARERTGGRVLTHTPPGGGTPVELGATWLARKHRSLTALLAELGLDTFPQRADSVALYEQDSRSGVQRVRLPHNPEPSHRIRGGTSALIAALEREVPHERLHLSRKAVAVMAEEGALTVTCSAGEQHTAEYVVSTLPPQLLVDTVSFSPPLPADLVALAHQTHTWMGDSIKAAVSYRKPFWRKPPASGTAFSQAGPLTELYDHGDADDELHALVGFCDPARYTEAVEDRRAAVLAQLRRFYGNAAAEPLAYTEALWRRESHTSTSGAPDLVPHQHNGDPIFRQLFLGGRFSLAGTETAPAHPGYLDGAVASANWVAGQLAPRA